MNLVSLAITAAFYLLFAASVRRYVDGRDPVQRAVVLVFSSIVSFEAVSWLGTIIPAASGPLNSVALALLLSQPILMVRLVGLFRPLPSGALEAATAASLVPFVWYHIASGSTISALFLVVSFAATETCAAAVLLLEARHRPGFPSFRLVNAAVASVLFGVSVVVSDAGVASLWPTAQAQAQGVFVSRLLELVAAFGYLVAFVPPRWVRDLAHRAIAYDLVRDIVAAPTGTDPEALWASFARTVGDVLGSVRVRVRVGDREIAVPADDGPRGGPGVTTDRPTIAVSLISEGRAVGVLEAELPARPLFLEDDIALIELLGSLTARAVEREQAVGTLTEAERALAEADALRASEARFRALLDAEPNAIFIVDRDGRVRWVTASAERMFGMAERELVGQRLDALVTPSHADRAGRGAGGGEDAQASEWSGAGERGIASGAGGSGARRRYEARGRSTDGRIFPVEVTVAETELDGSPSQIAVVTDITWRKESDALRDQFIGVLSHELRTPVTAIFGGTQLLLRPRGIDEATRRELVADVAAESERLQRIIENLLVLARVERRADVTEAGPVLAQRVLATIVERERARNPTLRLSLTVADTLPVVSADDASIALVMRNLISNAAKYAGPTAQVEVAASDSEDGVVIRVIDDGPGIAPEDESRLFDLYFRSESTKETPGSGIGLFVCRQLIEAMGGRIRARSRPEGGTEIAFTLRHHEAIADSGDDVVSGLVASTAAGR